ncbi:MAG: peroxide stress protein YaaA [Burkholderiales bacterium]|nr:peroxide stress protein YaaA [Burkholderiales bacterium]
MLFVLSPAKTLDYERPVPTERHTLPDLTHRSAELITLLRRFTPLELGRLMELSDPLAALNVARYHAWQPEYTAENSKQAVFAFMGDVYEGLDAASLDAPSLDYLQARVRILSGLYGVLRPLDRMQPYRLEMGTRLANPAGRNLYDFWGDTVTDMLSGMLADAADPVLVNLASDEYFKVVRPKRLKARVVECVFQERKGEGYKIVSFYAKRARGLMARYAASIHATQPEALRDFDREGYRFAPDASDESRYVFRREAAPAKITKAKRLTS